MIMLKESQESAWWWKQKNIKGEKLSLMFIFEYLVHPILISIRLKEYTKNKTNKTKWHN